jgi:ketosteroid isomerase-like protein
MSQENVELAARWYELWSETSKVELMAGMPRVMEFCHPQVEWSQPEEGWTHWGREGVRAALERWLKSFDECWYELQRIVDCGGDEVLVVGLEVGGEQSAGPRSGRLATSCSPSGTARSCASASSTTRAMPAKPPGLRSRPDVGPRQRERFPWFVDISGYSGSRGDSLNRANAPRRSARASRVEPIRDPLCLSLDFEWEGCLAPSTA